jgi:hypothetical protein
MRSAFIAAMSALATLIMFSVASAQNVQRVLDPPYVRNDASAMRHDNSSDADGITVEQENMIPYHPCTRAVGWVNGHLVCRND